MTRIHDNSSPQNVKLICRKAELPLWSSCGAAPGIWNQSNQLSFMCLILLFILLFVYHIIVVRRSLNGVMRKWEKNVRSYSKRSKSTMLRSNAFSRILNGSVLHDGDRLVLGINTCNNAYLQFDKIVCCHLLSCMGTFDVCHGHHCG